LMLRLRVRNYRAGDLERAYPKLAVEEDYFINYGFVPRSLDVLMHPRTGRVKWDARRRTRSAELLEFIREHGAVHPRAVDAHFAHGRVRNYWGGTSSFTTQLLDSMHYRSMLRVVRRESGIRIYAAREPLEPVRDPKLRDARLDALVDQVMQLYAPLPAASLAFTLRRLRYATPQWSKQLTAAIKRGKERFAHAHIAGHEWYWPAAERPNATWQGGEDTLCLLTPFDPIVWDRKRFEMFWGWAYRFEAYTPVAKRKLGYYALPLLWRDHVVAWANVSVKDGQLDCELGFVEKRPKDRGFDRALETELVRMRTLLGLASN
jgi:uncharacterized protein YcaQ